MARSSLLMHIIMMSVVGAIGFLYIYPTIGQIRINQDTAVLFAKELTKVSAVNDQLEQKLVSINNIPLQDKQKLITYMPDTLDDVMFLRTMEAILLASGIEPSTLQFGSGKDSNNEQSASSDDSQEASTVTDKMTIQNNISVAFETDETSLFGFFAAVEQSDVPFVIKEAVLTPSDGGGVAVELVYVVQALSPVKSPVAVVEDLMGFDMEIDNIDF